MILEERGIIIFWKQSKNLLRKLVNIFDTIVFNQVYNSIKINYKIILTT